MLDTQQAC